MSWLSRQSESSDGPDADAPLVAEGHRPFWYMIAALVLTLVVLVALGWSAWRSYGRLEQLTHRISRIHVVQGEIARLDETLTMSARMAAASGDLRWEQRYLASVPALDAALAEANELTPGLAATTETETANQFLVAMEGRAFDLVREGRAEDGLALLTGEAYAEQKALYAQGMDDLDAALASEVEAASRGQRRRAIAHVVGTAIATPVIAVIWLFVLRTVEGWRRTVLRGTAQREALGAAVAASTQELASAAARIAASARQQEQSVRAFRASTTRAASAVHEIAATGGNLTRTMEDVNGLAGQTTERAATGRAKLQSLDEAMRAMQEATGMLAAKIDTINEAAGRIDLATSTMVRVVDQTELLSVNSAIEAGKAGENVGGFRVVSSEIRRLADQTATATLEIETIVEGIHASVSGGVREVRQFEQQVQESFERVQQVADELNGIIGDVARLSAQFSGISESMVEQATGTDQIRTAIEQLDGGAKEILESSSEFARVTRQLDDVGRALQGQVSSLARDA